MMGPTSELQREQMKKEYFVLAIVASTIFSTVSLAQENNSFSAILDRIMLPPGFKIEVFADMPKPRSIKVNMHQGIVFVGSRQGHIYSMADNNRDGVADVILERATGMNAPNGPVAKFHR